MARIGVLGPVMVDGAEGTLPPRERVVLAALTVRRGEAVSAETLADAWWGDRLPPTWTKALQGCLVQLRKALGPAAIETRPHGYRLVVPADEVDAGQFERRVARARELLVLGEPDGAAYAVDEAMSLWRGPALGELDGWEAGRVEAARLDGLRLDAQEMRVEAMVRAGRCREVLAEAQARVSEEPLREHRWRLLALAQYQAGRQGDALRTLHRARRVLVEELGLDPGPDVVALEEAILRQDPSLLSEQLPDPSPECPYMGLVSYDVGDADGFFGRDAVVSECLRRLADNGVLAVVGPSGSGKSSVVRAGIAAALRRDGRRVEVVTPGARPLDVVPLPSASPGGPVLVVDQCEEVVTRCTDTDDQAAFLTALVDHAERAPLVVALRGDRLWQLPAHSAFARIVERGLYLLQPMDEDDLRAAIEGPARQAGLRLEAGLVDLLVRDVEGEPGALPLLSHALRQTWQRREGRTLTVAGYRASGGIRGAVAQSAEALYERATSDQRSMLRDLLLRLVAPNPDGDPVRSRVARRAVATDAPHEQLVEQLIAARLVTSDEDAVELAHEALARAWPRLRGWLDDDVEGQRIWRHLSAAAESWDGMSRPESELYRGVRLDQAIEWRGRTEPDLNPVERTFLDASRAARDRQREREAEQVRRTARSNRRLRAQLAALAVALVVALVIGVVAVRERNTASRQRRTATARELAAAANANLDVDPERSILLALSAVATTRDRDGSVTGQAEEALHRAVKASHLVHTVPQGGWDVAVSSDGTRFATIGSGTTSLAGAHELDQGPGQPSSATLWDTRTGEELLALDAPDEAHGVAFSPDDRLVATAHADGSVRLWDSDTGEVVGVLEGHEGEVTKPEFSPDGRWLATGGADGTVRIWDVAARRESRRLKPDSYEAYSFSFSPDGRRLAAGGELATASSASATITTVYVWDLATGEIALELTDSELTVNTVAFSPDGRTLAGASFDGSTHVWDADTGEQLDLLSAAAPQMGVDVDPDGARIASAGWDGTARVWDAESGRELLSLPGHTGGGVSDVAFTPDGELLLTAGLDGTTRVWDVGVNGARDWLTVPGVTNNYSGVAFGPDGSTFAAPVNPSGVTVWDTETGEEIITLEGHEPKLTNVAFSPDGTRLVAGSDWTRNPPVWDLRTGELLFRLRGHEQNVRAVAYLPDGERIVSGGIDGTARLWDAATGEQEAVLRTDEGPTDAVAVSPDGRLIATGGMRGNVTLWDAATLERLSTLSGHEGTVQGLAFGPDGLLVTAGDDGVAKAWDVGSGDELSAFRGHSAVVHQVAVSPDGTEVATTSADGTTKLWDPTTGEERMTLYGHELIVFGVAFSPDGRLLASSSPDGTVAVHLLPIDEFVELARDRVTRALTDDECRRYLHRETCPEP